MRRIILMLAIASTVLLATATAATAAIKIGFVYCNSPGPDDGSNSSLNAEYVKIHTGHGTNGRRNLYWGSRGYIWNNDGDKATLTRVGGRIVDTCKVGIERAWLYEVLTPRLLVGAGFSARAAAT